MPLKDALYIPSKKRHERKVAQLEMLEKFQKEEMKIKDIVAKMELPLNYVNYLIREQRKHAQNKVIKEYVEGLLLQQFSFEEIQAATNLSNLKLKFLFLFYEIEKELYDKNFVISAVLQEAKRQNIKDAARKMNVHFSTIKNIVAMSKLEDALDDWSGATDGTVFNYKDVVVLEEPYFFTKVEEEYFEYLVKRLILEEKCGYQRVRKIFGFNSTDAQTIIDYCLRNEDDIERNRNWRYPVELIEKMRADFNSGMPNREIEEKYNLSRNQFKGIRKHYQFAQR